MPAYKIEMGEIVFGNCEELSVSDVYDLACEIGKVRVSALVMLLPPTDSLTYAAAAARNARA